MTSTEDRLKDAIVLRFEGMGEAWTTDDSGDTLARAAAEVVVRELSLDGPSDDPRDRGALWHLREAQRCASQASMLSANPGATSLEHIRLLNPEVQTHLREMAQVHATLFAGLVNAMSTSPHSSARAQVANIAAMADEDH